MKSIITAVILFIATAHLLKIPFRESSWQKENLLLEQTSILMVLDDALLQTKTDNFRFQLLQQETKYLLLVFLFMKLVKQQLMLLIFKKNNRFTKKAIH
jgi:hypothetical protein